MKDIRQNWKALAAARNIKKEDIAALCIYQALRENEGVTGAIMRLRKSFRPITNSVKLQNGAQPYLAPTQALRRVVYSSLIDWIDEEDQSAISQMAIELARKGALT